MGKTKIGKTSINKRVKKALQTGATDMASGQEKANVPSYRVWIKNPEGDDFWYAYKSESEAKKALPRLKEQLSGNQKIQGTFVAYAGREWELKNWNKHVKG